MTRLTNKPVAIIGSGGHAKVCLDILLVSNITPIGIVGPAEEVDPVFAEIDHFNDEGFQKKFTPDDVILVNGIGIIPNETRHLRKKIFDLYKGKGYEFLSLIHPSAIVSSSASIGEGSQVMAGCVLQCHAEVGQNTIINTRVSLDHDCKIADHVHIAPGATLCGDVSVGSEVFVTAGSVIIHGKKITSDYLKARK